MTVPFSFIIPPFSFAIDFISSPRCSVCSISISVIIDTTGFRTFVASSLPPMPTSTTAKSTFSIAKYINAIAVVNSKKVSCIEF